METLNEIINYFNTHDLPNKPVVIMGCATINDPKNFYETSIKHLTTCKKKDTCWICKSYLIHLNEFYKEVTK